jgi:hypothetical protein
MAEQFLTLRKANIRTNPAHHRILGGAIAAR